MQFEIKVLSPDAVSRALAKAERYRFLNEPAEAESICEDALAVDPRNQQALATLLLAITDQFDDDARLVARALETVARLENDYERAYYTGIIYERRAKALLRHRTLRGGPTAYEWLRQAMSCFEMAEAIRPPGNDDTILRWNACARMIMANYQLTPAAEEPHEPLLLE